MKINVLGTPYAVRISSEECDRENADGLTDRFRKEIILKKRADMLHDCQEPDVLEMYDRRCRRHELIHAFFFESGMEKYGMDEDLVDLLALKWPQMCEAMSKMGAMEP